MRAIGNVYIVYVRKMNIGASSSSTETVIHTVTNVYMCKFIIFPEGGGGVRWTDPCMVYSLVNMR